MVVILDGLQGNTPQKWIIKKGVHPHFRNPPYETPLQFIELTSIAAPDSAWEAMVLLDEHIVTTQALAGGFLCHGSKRRF